MPKIRDLGINTIPVTMRPPEIGAGGAEIHGENCACSAISQRAGGDEDSGCPHATCGVEDTSGCPTATCGVEASGCPTATCSEEEMSACPGATCTEKEASACPTATCGKEHHPGGSEKKSMSPDDGFSLQAIAQLRQQLEQRLGN